MNKRRIKIWLSAAAFLAVGIFLVFQLAAVPQPELLLPNALTDSDWIKGNPDSEIVVIEYSDFQCPACAGFAELMDEMMDEFGDHIKFSYRHYPLEQLHPFAKLAAQAAEAAGQQGKFWEMHDLLFTYQADWYFTTEEETTQALVKFAEDLSLDIDQFKNDLNSQTTINAVQADLSAALKAGLYYTPTFFLNGKLIENPRTKEEFRELLRTTIENENT